MNTSGLAITGFDLDVYRSTLVRTQPAAALRNIRCEVLLYASWNFHILGVSREQTAPARLNPTYPAGSNVLLYI